VKGTSQSRQAKAPDHHSEAFAKPGDKDEVRITIVPATGEAISSYTFVSGAHVGRQTQTAVADEATYRYDLW